MPTSINDIPGRRIHLVLEYGGRPQEIPARGKVPGRRLLPNYWVEAGGEQWLVLYNYGNDTLPDRLERRFFGADPYTIAVRKKDGAVAHASAGTERRRGKNLLRLNLEVMSDDEGKKICLPRAYRRRLGELESAKRPYRVGVSEFALLLFTEQEASLRDLQRRLTLTFRFWGAELAFEDGDWYSVRRLR